MASQNRNNIVFIRKFMYQSRLNKLLVGSGSTKDMTYVSWCLLHGIETQQNIESGVDWLTKAAMLGDSEAQVRLAELYESGEFVKTDCEKAMLWYSQAEKEKEFYGAYALAIAYHFGSSCYQQNKDQAYKYFSMASSRGHLVSRAQLAKLKRTGKYGIFELIHGYVMPVEIGLMGCWLIITKRCNDEFWDAERWLPQVGWIRKLSKGTLFDQ